MVAHRRSRRARGPRCAGTRRRRRRSRLPRIPSSRPASKPSEFSRRWSSVTSSPRNMAADGSAGGRRARSRSRRAWPTSAGHRSVDARPRCSWNARTAAPCAGRTRPARRPSSRAGPAPPSRRWRSPDGPRRGRRGADARRGSGSTDELGEILEELTLALGADEALHGSPSLNTIIVGMLITSKRRAVSGLSSTLSLAMRELARVLVGDLLEHRGDHLARDHTTRPRSRRAPACSAPPTVSSKVASESVTMSSATEGPFAGRSSVSTT